MTTGAAADKPSAGSLPAALTGDSLAPQTSRPSQPGERAIGRRYGQVPETIRRTNSYDHGGHLVDATDCGGAAPGPVVNGHVSQEVPNPGNPA